MSHEINETDKQQGLTQAWHGLTEILPVIDLKTCFLSTWDVIKRPLFRFFKDGSKEQTESCEIVCTDDEKIVIGKPVHKSTYTLLTNARFLQIIADSIAQIPGAVVASVGSVCSRARIFVSVEIPEYYTKGEKTVSAQFIAAGREFKCYLNFLSSHDKSCGFVVNMGSICTVCNNTFTCNLLDAGNKLFRVVIKHTSGMEDKLADVPALIGAFFATVEHFKTVMNALALVPVSEQDAQDFITGFLYVKDDDEFDSAEQASEMSTRRANQVSRMVELFKTGKGNAGQNLADLFSAITDYYTHESSGGEDKLKQVASSEFGNGNAMKSYAFAVMQDDKRIAKLIQTGKKVREGQKKA